MSNKLPNASEMGKIGGKRIMETRGASYMSELGKKSWENRRKNDPDYGKRLAAAGLKARIAKKAKAHKSSVDKVTDLLIGKQ